MRSYTVKENYIVSVVSKILLKNRQTKIMLLLYEDELNLTWQECENMHFPLACRCQLYPVLILWCDHKDCEYKILLTAKMQYLLSLVCK